MNEISMRVSLEVYQNTGSLRFSEEITLGRDISLEEAAVVLSKFSELARTLKQKTK
jgi:hypothetical protein